MTWMQITSSCNRCGKARPFRLAGVTLIGVLLTCAHCGTEKQVQVETGASA